MSQGQVMEVFRDTLFTIFKLAGPPLIASLVVGLVIAIVQAATQIHEQTITFVPKLFAIGIMLLIIGPWMMTEMDNFIGRLVAYMLTL